jgi:uncharacterized membrane protein YfcA
MGYGVTATSVLVTFGVAPAIASASIHTSETVVDIASAIAHHRNGNVDLTVSKHLLIPGIAAAILGAVFISGLSLGVAKPLVKAALIMLGLGILYQSAFEQKAHKRLDKLQAMALGFIAAFIDVAVGGGWGPIGTPALILSGEEPRKAVGVIEFTEPIISLTAVISFGVILGFEKFMWDIALPMILGGLILTPVAAYLTKRPPRRLLGTAIGTWLVALNLWGLLV